MKANLILKTLDKYAEDYNFPVLDSYNFDLAQCRLSVFRNEEEWLLVFEIVGVNPNLDIANELYVYGNATKQQGIIISIDDIVSFKNGEDLFDDDGEFLVDPLHLNLMVNGDMLNLSPEASEYNNLGLTIEPFTPTKLIRYLSSVHKEKFWLDREMLSEEIELNDDLKLFYQIDEWAHPDEEKPSGNKFFQSLAKAIELNDTTIIDSGQPNTHWSHWVWSDFEKQEED
ncbi:hypothetical protein P4679_25075 [Priestia megaterium]|uniref:DUF7003 family protein n=1 Tax=Priestia megaterium TaxID=1404 RepID=UPI002E1FA46B|nr:hypothetical protein [Priestia megaterium]